MDNAFFFGIFDSFARFFKELFTPAPKKKKGDEKKGSRKGVKKKV